MNIHTIGTQQKRIPFFLFFLIAALLTFPISYAQPYGPDLVREEIALAFKSDGIKKSYVIALDRIGIVVSAKKPHEEVMKLVKKINGEIVQSDERGIHIIKLSSDATGSRKDLDLLARELRNMNQILQAGLVLYRSGYQSPLIATDQLVVEFEENMTKAMVKDFAQDSGLILLMNDPYFPQQWLLQLDTVAGHDVFTAAELAGDHPNVKYALPNFTLSIVPRQFVPDDPLFVHQWHHLNTGQAEGTFDADIDSELAWSITQGDEDVIIAIIDEGFDVNHEDLELNLWHNPGENGEDSNGSPNEPNDLDDEGNNHIDDINGYDYTDCFLHPNTLHPPNCGTGNISVGEHGTLVAGVAAGRGDNEIGISGVCPRCSLMLIQQANSGNHFGYKFAFYYADNKGAKIISNSWGYGNGAEIPWYLEETIELVASHGKVIFFAMDNYNQNECEGTAGGFPAIEGVIAISAASNWDRKVTESGYGDCIDLLAPTHKGYGPEPNEEQDSPSVEFSGTLNIATTDITGDAGYNNTNDPNDHPRSDPDFCTEVAQSEDPNRNYTLCFGGTSAATPVAAGIGGLILSADNALSREQVQNLLQDTADKIEPGMAFYELANGKSWHDGTSTHGYGRVNAFEAVRVVAPVTETGPSGLGGTDIFIRDNELDWGNTAQQVENAPPWRAGSNVKMGKTRGFIGHYKSVDIKVDAPPYDLSPPITPTIFDGFIHENPISGALNKVYVRVRNRGPEPAENVQVKLHWTMAGTALPDLPGDFWDVWPEDTSDQAIWHSLGSREISMVGYSGASVAGTSADGSVIVSFDFTGPPLNPSLQSFRHHCLFAVIDSNDDPIREPRLTPGDPAGLTRLIPDVVTPTNNNVTHLNVAVQDAVMGVSGDGFMVRNPFTWSIKTRLILTKPKKWKVSLSKFGDGQPFELAAGEEIPITIKIAPGEKRASGEVEIRQEIEFKENFQPFGGFTFRFPGK